MSEDAQPEDVEPSLPPTADAAVVADPSLRVRLRATRDRWLDEAASHVIRLGRDNPRLRDAGLWLYGTATLYLPRGTEVPKLGHVGDHVYRGGQPSLRAFATLHEMGIDTIINLRPESDHERGIVEQLGMHYIYMPLPPLDAPTHTVTTAFLEAATDPVHGEVFFHCFHGVDRTGTMAACLRIARDGWDVEKAIAEMRAFGVHEKGQKAKLDYVAEFFHYWHGLDDRRRREILHIPMPEEPAPAPPPPPPVWWARPALWARAAMERLRRKP